jgi:pyruvate formate lyase activating enzyme
MAKEAKFYRKLPNQQVQCNLCPYNCQIHPEKRGVCRVRYNDQGTLIAENYGLVTSVADDPIEKKPLYHFFPGSRILSLGTFGCNFHCIHCQNWEISQNDKKEIATKRISIADLLYFIRESGHKLVAFTYNEPLIWYEYVLEASQALQKLGVKVVLVTNGYINRDPLLELLPFVNAHSLDIKWFSPKIAQRLSGVADPAPVFEYARIVHKAGQHLEIVTNLVDGYNDSVEELTGITQFIATELSPNIPWHISRSFPAHRLPQLSPTSLATLENAQAIGRQAGLRNIHLGNI